MITHQSEIWQKSNCLDYEDQVNHDIFEYLQENGFIQSDHFRVWHRGDQTVVASLVDDIRSCSNNYHVDLPYLYDRKTIVITDNLVNCPTMYRVIRVPESFFGIYSYTPNNQIWNPDRDFSFSVNRIDIGRFLLFLDLAWRTNLELGYVNFNCQYRLNPDLSPIQAFNQFWTEPGSDDKIKFARVYEKFNQLMPYKNYSIDFDSVLNCSWVNIILETYNGDNSITLSEKIFRVLVTPAPWVVYSGRYTVAYLESLGFDCLGDIIDHGHYDKLKEVENKKKVFNWKSLEIVKDLKQMGIDRVRERCLKASTHNQKLLADMKHHWPMEFNSWLSNLKL